MQDPSAEPNGRGPCCAGFVRYGIALGVAFVCGGIAYWFWPQSSADAQEVPRGIASVEQGSTRPTEPVTPSDVDDDEPTAESEDERMAKTIVGRWKTQRDSGPRDLVVKPDGTAKMTVNIESVVGRLLFQTEQMVMNISWRIEDCILHFKMVDGTPKTSVDLLIKSYGDVVAYPILECSADRLLVKDGGSDPDHDWSRVGKTQD